MKIKIYLAFTCLFYVGLGQNLKAGQDRGGGDPIAIEFVNLLSQVAVYLHYNENEFPDLDRVAMLSSVRRIRKSLDDNEIKDLIEVVETRPEANGVKKAATYHKKSGQIKVHRSTWVESDQTAKLVLVTMEGLGVSGRHNSRYTDAFDFIKRNQASILNFDPMLSEQDIDYSKYPSLTGYGQILVLENSDLIKLNTCTEKKFIACEQEAKPIEVRRVNENSSWYILRTGLYAFINKQTLKHEIFELKDGERKSSPNVTKVTVSSNKGPGHILATIYQDWDHVENQENLLKGALWGDDQFPMRIKSQDFSDLFSINTKPSLYYQICSSLVRYIHYQKDDLVSEKGLEACKKALDSLSVTRNEIAEIFFQFSKQTVSYLRFSPIEDDCDTDINTIGPTWIKELRRYITSCPHGIAASYSKDEDGSSRIYFKTLNLWVHSPVVHAEATVGFSLFLPDGHYRLLLENESGGKQNITFSVNSKQKKQMTLQTGGYL